MRVIVMVVLIGGLGACRGCAKSDEAHPDASPAAAPIARAEKVQPPEAALGGKYWVILSSSEEPGVTPPGLATIEAHPELGVEVRRLPSARFKRLEPCYEVIVAGAETDKAKAVALSRRLAGLGVDNYVKNAGPYVGVQSAVEAWCAKRRQPAKPVEACGDLRFAERWADTIYVALEAPLDDPGKPKPLAPRAWAAPLAARELGGVRVGDAFRVFGHAGVEGSTCTVTRFAALTRGTPHFSHGRNEEGEIVEPEEPGCGSPEAFAELDCKLEIGGAEDAALWAIGPGGRAPGIYQRAALADDAESAVIAAVTRSPAYRAAQAEATAREAGEPTIELQVKGFESGATRLAIADVSIYTGEGDDRCGGEDLRIEMRAVYPLHGAQVSPPIMEPRRVEPTEIEAVLDLEGDGRAEILISGFPDRREIVRESGAVACAIEIPFCDCGC